MSPKPGKYVSLFNPGILILLLAVSGCQPSSAPSDATSSNSTKTKSQSSDAKSTSIKPRVLRPTPGPFKRTWDSKGIADFELTERSGKTISKKDLLGKPWIVSFIFTRCAGPCPKVSYEMYKLQEWLRAHQMDVQLVSISVDPQTDTPEVLKKYAENFGADSKRWWFLTGDRDKVYKLINESFRQVVRESQGAFRKPGFEVIHTTALLLVDEKGRVVEGYNGQYDKTIADLHRRLRAWKKFGSFEVDHPESAPTKPVPAKKPSSRKSL